MFWLVLLAAFLLAVPAAYGLARRVRAGRSWSRVLKAAAIIPGSIILLIILASLLAMATMPENGENGWGMTNFLLILFGAPIAAATFAGGLLGAAFGQRKQRL